MIIKNLFPLFIFVSLIIDSTAVALPLFFASATTYYILSPSSITLAVLFIAGMILDALKVEPAGFTPIALGVAFLIIHFWRLQAELKDPRMTVVIVFVFTYVYARIFNYNSNLIIYAAIFGVTALLFSYFSPRPSKFRKTN